MEGHAVHDDFFYVPEDVHEAGAPKDPIERFRAWLREHDGVRRATRRSSARRKALLNDAVRRAEASPLPDPARPCDGVWAEPEELDTPHHKYRAAREGRP